MDAYVQSIDSVVRIEPAAELPEVPSYVRNTKKRRAKQRCPKHRCRRWRPEGKPDNARWDESDSEEDNVMVEITRGACQEDLDSV